MVQYHGTPLFRHVELSVDYENEFSIKNALRYYAKQVYILQQILAIQSLEMDQKPKMESYIQFVGIFVAKRQSFELEIAFEALYDLYQKGWYFP
jgi:hypothetical protein